MNKERTGKNMKVISEEEGKRIELFEGVKGRILMSGERIMFLLVEIEKGRSVPMHKHTNEQFGLCLRGKAEFAGEKDVEIVESGMFYGIASNEPHSVRMIGDESGVFLDVFSPPREDYLAKLGKSQ